MKTRYRKHKTEVSSHKNLLNRRKLKINLTQCFVVLVCSNAFAVLLEKCENILINRLYTNL